MSLSTQPRRSAGGEVAPLLGRAFARFSRRLAKCPTGEAILGRDRGRGLAFTLSFGVPVAEVIEVTNTPDGIKIDKVFVAVDVGPVLDPENFENQIQGGVIWGLGHAMNGELTYKDGIAEQTNYDAFEGMRFYQAPSIQCWWPAPSDSEIRGMGEPSVPPAAPALANAIFAATGHASANCR